MAGTNGKPKFLRCNRNDEVDDLKIRGTLFQFIADNTQLISPITADEWLQPIVQIVPGAPNPAVGPSALELFTLMSQQAPPTIGETAQVILSNHDSVARTINFPSGWNPTSIVLAPLQQLQIVYRLVTTNPPTYQILTVIDVGSSSPGANGALPSLTEFALTPSVAFDTIVRNATNTLWVPSGTTTGEHVPWLRVNGTLAGSGQNEAVHITDVAPNGSTGMSRMILCNNTQLQATFPNFDMFEGISTAVGFGARGIGTQDVIYRSLIPALPQAQGFHALFDTTGSGAVFYVRSSGATHVTLAAGPAVVNPIALNAAGEICSGVSSSAYKENIVDATDTTCVNNFNVREFNYIGDGVKRIGGVVEEMEPLVPSALKAALINYQITQFAYTDSQGVSHPMIRDLTKPESVNLEGVVFCLMEELQKLRARVADLEA